jgi:glycosyltransferase involved in cell wall biosynthesis
MKIRIIDYVANFGGGIRFSTELIKSLIKLPEKHTFEILSTGNALERYRSAISKINIDCVYIDLPTKNHYKNNTKKLLNIPGSQILSKFFGYGSRWHYPISESAFTDCDIVWLPWIHQHRPPFGLNANVTASFHDAILFQFPNLIKKDFLNEEKTSYDNWVDNENIKIVVSSNTTIKILNEIFDSDELRFKKIEIAGNHLNKKKHSSLMQKFSFLDDKGYLFYPANTSPHKNHDNLIKSLNRLDKNIPLVLSGAGSDIKPITKRGRYLRNLIKVNKLKLNNDIFPIGYVTDDQYENLLSRSKALIMPSLSEGGGSFPLYEALFLGIPALVADIPVLREHMERASGEVIWFDPLDPYSISQSINEMIVNYDFYKKRAEKQISSLETRSWDDVAIDYQKTFKE